MADSPTAAELRVAEDGRFLMLKSIDPAADNRPKRIIVVENWFEEVKRALPGPGK